ncbi:MAG: HupE/UreJ family protein, partial [Pseudomonadota bacterium]
MERSRLFDNDRRPLTAARLVGSHNEIGSVTVFLRCLLVLAMLQGVVWHTPSAHAHEIPTDVVVQSYLAPADDRVELLLRVPLEAMRDVDLPIRGPGYIDIPAADTYLRDAAEIWLANFVTIHADRVPLDTWRIDAVRLSLPSNRSFANYESATTHIDAGNLSPETDIYRDQALFDVRLLYPLDAAADDFAIEPNFGRLGLRTTTVLNFLPAEGVRRVFEFSGSPGLVPLDPRWHQAFLRFVRLGVDHILGGIDHILFVLCLIVPFRRFLPLFAIVTSFTVAHSITLVGSAFGLAPTAPWFPPLIETLIAVSIVYMALENIVGSRWDRRWLIAFAFGLVHGFGFSFALSETLQFAGSHLLTSLFAFNVGVELGQLMLIAIAVPILNRLFQKA